MVGAVTRKVLERQDAGLAEVALTRLRDLKERQAGFIQEGGLSRHPVIEGGNRERNLTVWVNSVLPNSD